MAYEPKPGQFSLFKNQNKTEDNHPDYTGSGMDPKGQIIRIAAWLKESKTGTKFMSCSIKYENDNAPPKRKARHEEFDDSMPF